MKREILFRGKSIISKEWVYGYLAKDNHDTMIFRIDSIGDDGLIHDMVVVDPETVGQFTGTEDKNGNKIFEDDIVESTRCIAVDPEEGDKENCVVGWDDTIVCGFSVHVIHNGLKSARTLSSYSGIRQKDYTVVGNIHDNPELLK